RDARARRRLSSERLPAPVRRSPRSSCRAGHGHDRDGTHLRRGSPRLCHAAGRDRAVRRGRTARSLVPSRARRNRKASSMKLLRTFVPVLLAGASLLPHDVHAQTTLRVVMYSDLKILDPIWSGGYITRNHGYMIYDTLFATDAHGEIRPQMVGRYDVSADKLTYTMTLRDGLVWHDGKPVTAEDCVASIKRWGNRDSSGQKRTSFVSA